jgi:hypothetical protein
MCVCVRIRVSALGLCDYACLNTRYAVRRRILRYGWRTTVVMRLKGGFHVAQQIPAQYAVNAVDKRGHVSAHEVLDVARGPSTLPNDHVDPTADMKLPDRIFRLQAISRASHSPPPKATSQAYKDISDASREFWDCGSGSGGGTRGVTGFRTLFRKRI